MGTHVVFAGQNRVHFVPDDRLTVVESYLLQDRWIIATVAISAPQVKGVTWQKHPRQVAEPGLQQTMEFWFGKEVVGQRPVLGPQLPGRWTLLGVAFQVQPRLMRVLKGGQAGRHGVLGARFHPDPIGGIAVSQADRLTSEQAIQILGTGRIAAKEPMLAQDQEIAFLGDRLVGRLGNGIGIRLPWGLAGKSRLVSCSSLKPVKSRLTLSFCNSMSSATRRSWSQSERRLV